MAPTATSLHPGFHQGAQVALESHHNFPSVHDLALFPQSDAAGAFQMSTEDENPAAQATSCPPRGWSSPC